MKWHLKDIVNKAGGAREPRVAGSIPAAATFCPSGRQIWGVVDVRESATTDASIHCASNRLCVSCFSATGRGRGHRQSCLPVASVAMAAGTTAATSIGLSECFGARLKELAMQDIDALITATR